MNKQEQQKEFATRFLELMKRLTNTKNGDTILEYCEKK